LETVHAMPRRAEDARPQTLRHAHRRKEPLTAEIHIFVAFASRLNSKRDADPLLPLVI
jgi:hypothetical protein